MYSSPSPLNWSVCFNQNSFSSSVFKNHPYRTRILTEMSNFMYRYPYISYYLYLPLLINRACYENHFYFFRAQIIFFLGGFLMFFSSAYFFAFGNNKIFPLVITRFSTGSSKCQSRKIKIFIFLSSGKKKPFRRVLYEGEWILNVYTILSSL